MYDYSKTEKDISGVVEFAPVTQTIESESAVTPVEKTNLGNKLLDRLKNTLIFNKKPSGGELNLVPTTPAPIVQVDRSIVKGTTVLIEANELLPAVSNWTILGGLVTASAIAIATMMATVTQYKV